MSADPLERERTTAQQITDLWRERGDTISRMRIVEEWPELTDLISQLAAETHEQDLIAADAASLLIPFEIPEELLEAIDTGDDYYSDTTIGHTAGEHLYLISNTSGPEPIALFLINATREVIPLSELADPRYLIALAAALHAPRDYTPDI